MPPRILCEFLHQCLFSPAALALCLVHRTDIFVFLLSTRAGGLGINLTAADTVSPQDLRLRLPCVMPVC